ncbi:MAG TPA: hypothetical protein VNV35_07355 [Puia sp.]|nr:hypothetical protein [Puia sp.]
MKTIRLILCTSLIAVGLCCSKKSNPGNNGGGNNGNGNTSSTYDSTYSPVDPAVTATQGFFLDDWAAKVFTVPNATASPAIIPSPTDTVWVDADVVLTKVSKYLFGGNSNLWMGQIVTQPALMQYITDLSPNVIRGPAGSISDVYFFNTDAQPGDVPDTLLNGTGGSSPADYWFGQNTQSWTLAIDNYYSLLQQTNSVGLLTVNFGYSRYGLSANPVAAAAHLAAEWVRYDNGRTKFWEIGNEDYGNWETGFVVDTSLSHYSQPPTITGMLYGTNFLVFADSMRNAAQSMGLTIKIGAILLPTTVAGGNEISNWNQGVLAAAGSSPDFYIVHDYYPDEAYEQNSPGSQILDDAISMPNTDMNYLTGNIPAGGSTLKPIAMTEFNITSQGSQQQISFVNGMAGVLTVGELMKNHFGQGSRWDLANSWATGNDQGMFYNSAATGDPDPNETNWNPRACFYTLYFFQRFIGDRLVSSTSANSDLVAYSSTFAGSNNIASVIVNKGTVSKVVDLNVNHYPMGANFYFYTLQGGTDNGEFSAKVSVNGVGPSGTIGGPLNYSTIAASSTPRSGNNLIVYCPARSIVCVAVDSK